MEEQTRGECATMPVEPMSDESPFVVKARNVFGVISALGFVAIATMAFLARTVHRKDEFNGAERSDQ